MRRARSSCFFVPAACLAAFALALGSGCTFLVQFDDRGDAGLCDGACGVDATLPEATPGDAYELPDAQGPADVPLSGDVGDCTVLSEGSPCAKPTACSHAWTCQGGVCAVNPLPDGTSCGAAVGACQLAPVCAAGYCAAPALVANGTVCGPSPGACHEAPVCESGTCAAPAISANGTKCGTTEPCHDPSVCKSGACVAGAALADGTSSKSGDANARCCSGSAVETTSTTNCGVCGWKCGAGQSCAAIDGEYVCTGCTADSDCASGCCSESPAPNHCSPGNCAGACQSPDVCTGGSHCVAGATIDYCSY